MKARPVQEVIQQFCGKEAAEPVRVLRKTFQMFEHSSICRRALACESYKIKLIKSLDLDVEPSFCTGLYEHGTMLLCFGFSIASGHFPVDIQVTKISLDDQFIEKP